MTDEPTNFLYPFIDAQEGDPKSLLADLAARRRPRPPKACRCAAPRWKPTPN